jgi:predicted MPP superfamily phosphohydrolase
MSKLWPIIAIGDMHEPFSDRQVKLWAIEIIKEVKPKLIIQMGDLYDMFALSRFPKRIRMTADEEIDKGFEKAYMFWQDVKKAAPRAKCFQLLGNHDQRPAKKIVELCPEILSIYEPKPLWEFPKVETIKSNETIINNIVFEHGYRSKLGDHMVANDFMPTVRAHSHTGGVHFRRVGKNTGSISWELDCGYLGNPFDPELAYRTSQRFFKWTHGLGYITADVPCFVPYPGGKR